MAELSDIPIRKRSRQRYSVEYKRRLVEETLQKNTLAASVARTHGINANLLLRWRREYEMGAFGPVLQAAFVPVELSGAVEALEALGAAPRPRPFAKPDVSDAIEIFFGEIKLRVTGRPDAYVLRVALEALRS